MKRCGKSAPRRRQRRRHGKPHREQDRIGTARSIPQQRSAPGSMSRSCRPGWLLEAPGNRRPRGMAVTHANVRMPSRTRLTGRLTRNRRALGGTPPGARQFYVPSLARLLKGSRRSSWRGDPMLANAFCLFYSSNWRRNDKLSQNTRAKLQDEKNNSISLVSP